MNSTSEVPTQDSFDEQLQKTARQDPVAQNRTTGADHRDTGDSAKLDTELKKDLDYLQGGNCTLSERERVLDTKAVRGASRTGLNAAGYSYSEIEASFKRVLVSLNR